MHFELNAMETCFSSWHFFLSAFAFSVWKLNTIVKRKTGSAMILAPWVVTCGCGLVMLEYMSAHTFRLLVYKYGEWRPCVIQAFARLQRSEVQIQLKQEAGLIHFAQQFLRCLARSSRFFNHPWSPWWHTKSWFYLFIYLFGSGHLWHGCHHHGGWESGRD